MSLEERQITNALVHDSCGRPAVAPASRNDTRVSSIAACGRALSEWRQGFSGYTRAHHENSAEVGARQMCEIDRWFG